MTAISPRGAGALARALVAALRGEPDALVPPAGLGYPAPSAYPRGPEFPATAPAGLTPAGVAELAYLAELDAQHRREPRRRAQPVTRSGGVPHPDRGEGPAGPRVRPLRTPAAVAQARSRSAEHRSRRDRPAEESRMNAAIIDLQTERLARRTALPAAEADRDETCPVLLFHRRPTRPEPGSRRHADQR